MPSPRVDVERSSTCPFPHGDRRRRRAPALRSTWRAAAAAVAVATVVLAVSALPSAGNAATQRSRSRALGFARGRAALAPSATLSLNAHRSPLTVPRSFLGLSTEFWTIQKWAAHPAIIHRVFGMLSGGGPVGLRVGGNTADRSVWAPRRELPEWVLDITPAWMAKVSRVVRATHARLILDLNLMTATPALTARWARIALAALPPGSLRALEIGNEPDLYGAHFWHRVIAAPGALTVRQGMTAAGYAHAFAADAGALARAAPGIPLVGPALADPQKNFGWVSRLLHAPHPGLQAITVHRYPYSACAHPGTPTYPTIARLLSPQASFGMAQSVTKVEHISDRAGMPLWLTELNSVTCGGSRGVSNTFATALWAPDALFALLRAGVESASMHVRAGTINGAFSFTRRGLVARPLLYGMALFSRTLGPGAQLLPVHLATPARVHLTAWAVRIQGRRLHLLLIDKSAHAVTVHLRLPLAGPLTVARLTAPSVTSTARVTLGGQHLTPSGTWAGRQRTGTITPTSRGALVHVAGDSASLISGRLSRRA